jgi:ankyrin repeat protein
MQGVNMSKQRPTRIVYLLVVGIALIFIGRNLYSRYLNRALVAAIRDKNVSGVRRLLEQGADPNYRFVDETIKASAPPPQPVLKLVFTKMNPEYVGVFEKPAQTSASKFNLPDANLEQIGLLLLRHGARWQDGDYLAKACAIGDLVLTRELLDRGDEPNLPSNSVVLTCAIRYKDSIITSDGRNMPSYLIRTPEDKAEVARHLEVSRALVHLLEEHGAHLTLEQAQEIGDVAAVNKALAGMGASIDAAGYYAMTRAAGRGDLKTLSQLLDKGIDPSRHPERSSQVSSGITELETPLHAAVINKKVEAVRMLLAHGVDPNRIENNPYLGTGVEEAALTVAAQTGSLEMVQLLLAHGAKIDNDRSDCGSALEAALSSKHAALVRYLLAHGASAKVRPISPYPLLTIALRNVPEAVPNLLQHGAPVNLPSEPPVSPHSAPPTAQPAGMGGALVGLPPRVASSDPSADKNIRSSSTPPGAAITRPGMQGVGASALPHTASPLGPPPEYRREWQLDGSQAPYSPLMAAVFFAPQYEAALVARGAKIGPDRRWVCLYAATKRRMDLLPKLLAYGADINGVDSSRNNALSICMANAPEAVQTLLEHGANPNVLSQNLRTPLQEAALLGRTEQVRLLLAHGANVNAGMDRGHTALYWARKKNHADIVALLQQAGAKE